MQRVWRAHCPPDTPSSLVLCLCLRWLKPPSMPMEPLCVPVPCSPFPWGTVQELCPWEDGSLSRLSLLLGTLQATRAPIPWIYHSHCSLGYAINRDKVRCSFWSDKLHTCQVLLSGTAWIFCLAEKNYLRVCVAARDQSFNAYFSCKTFFSICTALWLSECHSIYL